MANETLNHKQPQQIQQYLPPQVLVLGPPTCFPLLESQFSHKFHFLNPKTSSLPIDQFIVANAHRRDPSSIRAILCAGGGCPVAGELLRLLPSVGVIVTTSAGTEHIDLAECRRRGIQVAGAGNLFSEDVADMAVGLLIDVVVNISAADRCYRSRIRSASWSFPHGSKVFHFFASSYLSKMDGHASSYLSLYCYYYLSDRILNRENKFYIKRH